MAGGDRPPRAFVAFPPLLGVVELPRAVAVLRRRLAVVLLPRPFDIPRLRPADALPLLLDADGMWLHEIICVPKRCGKEKGDGRRRR